MLEFVVLGQIPGTNIIVTFNGVMLAVPILLVMAELVYVFRRQIKSSITMLTMRLSRHRLQA